MYLAVDGAWASSFGTTRKKLGIEPFVSDRFSAEAETKTSRGCRLKTGATASTSRFVAGPTTASTRASLREDGSDRRGAARVELRVRGVEADLARRPAS